MMLRKADKLHSVHTSRRFVQRWCIITDQRSEKVPWSFNLQPSQKTESENTIFIGRAFEGKSTLEAALENSSSWTLIQKNPCGFISTNPSLRFYISVIPTERSRSGAYADNGYRHICALHFFCVQTGETRNYSLSDPSAERTGTNQNYVKPLFAKIPQFIRHSGSSCVKLKLENWIRYESSSQHKKVL